MSVGCLLPVSFSFTHAIGKRNSRFHFRFPFSYYIENGIATSIFVFRFPAILGNRICNCNLVFVRYCKIYIYLIRRFGV